MSDEIKNLEAACAAWKSNAEWSRAKRIELQAKLDMARGIVAKLLSALPDSIHEKDESWQWGWDELSGGAQDFVKSVRNEAKHTLLELNWRETDDQQA